MNLLLSYGENITSSNTSEDSSSASGSASSSEEEILKATNGIKNIGLAVFKEDEFIGKLSAIETMCHLIITNDLKSCNISIPYPNNEMRTIDFYLTLYAKPKN